MFGDGDETFQALRQHACCSRPSLSVSAVIPCFSPLAWASGVYCRHPQAISGTHLPGGGLMGAQRPVRREFLKSSAALAGGVTLGAVAPALGQQAPAQPPMIEGDRN